jgi:hypothetical protein
VGGISGAGITTYFEEYRALILTVTFAFLGIAFYLTYKPGGIAATPRASKIMTFNKIMLWIATVAIAVFMFFPQVMSDAFATSDEFTADMNRTVIQIEGMTWHTWTAKAKTALKSAPGVLAAKVDYDKKEATLGTKKGTVVRKGEILKALESIGYSGKF